MDKRIKNSRKQESALAAHYGGRRVPGSGNQWYRKNDVRTDRLSIEAKTTSKGQYTLKASELEEGEKHALLDGRDFLFIIEMRGRNWVVMAQEDYDLLVAEAGGPGGSQVTATGS